MSRIRHADLYGPREGKYAALERLDVATTEWTEIEPQTPWYLFTPGCATGGAEYYRWTVVTDVFLTWSLGALTKRDRLAVSFEKNALLGQLRDFLDPGISDPEAARRFGLPVRDKDRWDARRVRTDLHDSGHPRAEFVFPYLYRPFDSRSIYYHEALVARPNTRVLFHLCSSNVAMAVCRRGLEGGGPRWDTAFVADMLCDQNLFRRAGATIMPLYLYPAGDLAMETERKANLADGFLRTLRESIGNEAPAFTPEDVFHYIYAVFHSPTYRSRYEEFLAIDFPRVPLPGSDALFRELSRIGEELVALHLVRKAGADMPKYPIPGSDLVERVRYEAPTTPVESAGEGAESATAPLAAGRVWINKAQYFSPVPREVWDFHIGGYRVCEKWLKDRKGRTLGADDLEHYAKIVANVAETIRLMERVDEVTHAHGGWPAAFRGGNPRPLPAG